MAPCAEGREEPDPRPPTVAAAVEVVRSWLDEESRRDLAYMRKDDLIKLHHGFGTGIRNGLGLWGDNESLRKDCGEPHPDNCSGVIIRRLHARLRAELPAADRKALATLDSRVNKVQTSELAEQSMTLGALAQWLQRQIDAQLPAGKRFQVVVSPDDASQSFTVSLGGGSLHDDLEFLEFISGIDVLKRPPNYILEPYWRAYSGMEPETKLEPVIESDHRLEPDAGPGEAIVELIQDRAALQERWPQVATSGSPPPDVDFSRHSLLLVSYGEPIPFDDFKVLFAGVHRGEMNFAFEIARAPAGCQAVTRPVARTGVYLLPRFDGHIDHFLRSGSLSCN